MKITHFGTADWMKLLLEPQNFKHLAYKGFQKKFNHKHWSKPIVMVAYSKTFLYSTYTVIHLLIYPVYAILLYSIS